METVARRLTTDRPMSGYGFTHDTSDIAGGPVLSAYREGGSMERIVEQSLTLTSQLRAVDIAEAVTLVLNAHFLPDLMGNLKSFATQHFRCKSCGVQFRRPPLSGRCINAAKTASRAAGSSPRRSSRGRSASTSASPGASPGTEGVTPYLRQRVELLEASLLTLFPGTATQTTLETFAPAAAPPAA